MRVAELPGVDSPELPSGRRWRAVEDGETVGEVTAWLRSDDRLFLAFDCPSVAAYAPLADAVAEAQCLPLHTTVDEARAEAVRALEVAGFAVDYVEERFRIRFDAALKFLRRASMPTGFSLRTADNVDAGRLLELDDTLRRLVPGTDGWRGSLRLLRESLADASFEPRTYLVAVDDASGDYVGIARIWRNAPEPRFGMVAVLPAYRRTLVGPALVKEALTAAAEWGHATFTGETSLENEFIHPRLARVGAESTGRTLFLVRG